MGGEKHRSIGTKNHEKKIKEIDMNVVPTVLSDIKKQLRKNS